MVNDFNSKTNTVVMFDNYSTETKQIFDKNWYTENRVITQTASEDNLTLLEKNDTATKSIYIGDEKNVKEIIELNGGVCFTSAEFIALSQVIDSTSSNFCGDSIDKVKGINNRRHANKIKRLNKLGVHFKQNN